MIQINNGAEAPESRDIHTRQEILSQPELWEEVFHLVGSQSTAIRNFLNPILEKADLRVVLTGAGTSGYIGEAAQGSLQKVWDRPVHAVPTTEIVIQPESVFIRTAPTLLISFARSGNSPESTETLRLADACCDEVYHLIITCNQGGALANIRAENPDRFYCIVLPEATNDKSLAMTSSFTCMLLSVLVVAHLADQDRELLKVRHICYQGHMILKNQFMLKKLIQKDFERVVFLGSGEMLGIARECHLKLLELTDGKMLCMSDSFLGFRHGPRAFANERTLMVYLFSQNPHRMRYEWDLAEDIARDGRSIASLQVGGNGEPPLANSSRIHLNMDPENQYQMIPVTLVGQLLGYFSAVHAGINPDSPSASGSISRVVQGVNIYHR